MKRFLIWLKSLFFPPPRSSIFRHILPFILIVVILLIIFFSTLVVWEETNTVLFCGTTCHTMPPQYVTHSLSAHARETCEDCHMGRAPIFESVRRKIMYSWMTGSAMVFGTYEYPIVAKAMRPASDSCEPCHNPELFSDDKLKEIREFAEDERNTASARYLILKTGGGTRRSGLGYGIHWHIENVVEFYATDKLQQEIPFVRVTKADGSVTEYVDLQAGFDPKSITPGTLQRMDCITCHNRTAHDILMPADAINQMMARSLISTTIPDIRKQAYQVLTASYTNQQEAQDGIASLGQYYKDKFPDFYATNAQRVDNAIIQLQRYYRDGVFFDQKVDWATHPNNVGHQESAGCFRCHDGKHLSEAKEAVRLECNLCHSIPVYSSATDLVTNIPVSKGVEPQSHKNSNWITLHRDVYDNSCATCHTVEDPGGVSDTSFCSNSLCHGQSLPNTNFDAPKLREALKDQLPQVTQPTEVATTEKPVESGVPLSYADVAALFQEKCVACHASGGPAGVDLSSYAGIMAGGNEGALATPGDTQGSLIIKAQSATSAHFGQFSKDQLDKITRWIQDGAKP
jgi:hypothetical protein